MQLQDFFNFFKNRGCFNLLQKENKKKVFPEILSNYFKHRTQCPQDSFNYLETKHKGPQGPQDCYKLLENKAKEFHDILSNHFKNQTEKFPEFLSNYQKQDLHEFSEILSNYLKKHIHTRSPQDFFNFFKNRGCFNLLQKQNQTKKKGFPEILSNYFKHKTQCPQDSFKRLKQENTKVLKILTNHFKARQGMSTRFFQTSSKTRQKSRRVSFKLPKTGST